MGLKTASETTEDLDRDVITPKTKVERIRCTGIQELVGAAWIDIPDPESTNVLRARNRRVSFYAVNSTPSDCSKRGIEERENFGRIPTNEQSTVQHRKLVVIPSESTQVSFPGYIEHSGCDFKGNYVLLTNVTYGEPQFR